MVIRKGKSIKYAPVPHLPLQVRVFSPLPRYLGGVARRRCGWRIRRCATSAVEDVVVVAVLGVRRPPVRARTLPSAAVPHLSTPFLTNSTALQSPPHHRFVLLFFFVSVLDLVHSKYGSRHRESATVSVLSVFQFAITLPFTGRSHLFLLALLCRDFLVSNFFDGQSTTTKKKKKNTREKSFSQHSVCFR